jgi:hypothetical protein
LGCRISAWVVASGALFAALGIAPRAAQQAGESPATGHRATLDR